MSMIASMNAHREACELALTGGSHTAQITGVALGALGLGALCLHLSHRLDPVAAEATRRGRRLGPLAVALVIAAAVFAPNSAGAQSTSSSASNCSDVAAAGARRTTTTTTAAPTTTVAAVTAPTSAAAPTTTAAPSTTTTAAPRPTLTGTYDRNGWKAVETHPPGTYAAPPNAVQLWDPATIVADSGPVVGATITAVWFGPDNAIGTSDDVTYTTTTDSSGAFAFAVPSGSYRVTAGPALPDRTYDGRWDVQTFCYFTRQVTAWSVVTPPSGTITATVNAPGVTSGVTFGAGNSKTEGDTCA